jgi:predicted DsbA family dithiol-disulfide isomerase
MAKELTVEVWSDIACPWCYVGKRRLEAALARFPHRDLVRLSWHSFELDPSAPPVRDASQSYVARLAAKYGTGQAQAQGMIDRMVDTAAREGIAMDFRGIQSGNTFHAHRLLHLAKARGRQDALAERFMRAYLCEGGAIGDPTLLLRLAVEVGLDADEVSGVLSGDLYTDAVRQDQRDARQIGVDGVPFFLLGRHYAVAGAQPAELLLQALSKTWDELPEQTKILQTEGEPDGQVCGPDGCS